jgi:hypothetical protein
VRYKYRSTNTDAYASLGAPQVLRVVGTLEVGVLAVVSRLRDDWYGVYLLY